MIIWLAIGGPSQEGQEEVGPSQEGQEEAAIVTETVHCAIDDRGEGKREEGRGRERMNLNVHAPPPPYSRTPKGTN